MTQVILQEKRIADIARHQVAVVFREILSDPDAGLRLRDATTRRLQKSLKSKKDGRAYDLTAVLKRFGS